MQVNISPKALGPSAQLERPNTIECRRVVQISTRALRALSQGFDRNQAITFVFQIEKNALYHSVGSTMRINLMTTLPHHPNP